MDFLKNTAFGILLLCAFVSSFPAEDVAHATEIPASPDAHNNSAEVKEEVGTTTILATRVQDPGTAIPPLEHSTSKKVPEKPEPVATEQRSAEQAQNQPPKQNEKNSATSYNQVYSLAFSSVAVVLLSAI